MIRLDLSEADAIRLLELIRGLPQWPREYLHDVEVMLADEITTATEDERDLRRNER